MINEITKELLESAGWDIVCEHPIELEEKEGEGKAYGQQAADALVDSLRIFVKPRVSNKIAKFKLVGSTVLINNHTDIGGSKCIFLGWGMNKVVGTVGLVCSLETGYTHEVYPKDIKFEDIVNSSTNFIVQAQNIQSNHIFNIISLLVDDCKYMNGNIDNIFETLLTKLTAINAHSSSYLVVDMVRALERYNTNPRYNFSTLIDYIVQDANKRGLHMDDFDAIVESIIENLKAYSEDEGGVGGLSLFELINEAVEKY